MASAPAYESFYAALYVFLVLANVGSSLLGVYSCSVLLEVHLRPSVRWARFGFLWNLVAVTLIASMDWPLPLVCLFLLLFLGTQGLAMIGFLKDLRRRLERMQFASPRHEREWELAPAPAVASENPTAAPQAAAVSLEPAFVAARGRSSE